MLKVFARLSKIGKRHRSTQALEIEENSSNSVMSSEINQGEFKYEDSGRNDACLNQSKAYSSKKEAERLMTLLRNPQKFVWKDFLMCAHKTNIPRMLYILWEHKRQSRLNPSVHKPLPYFPRAFLDHSFAWLMRELKAIIGRSDRRTLGCMTKPLGPAALDLSITSSPNRDVQTTILLIQKTMKALTHGDPYDIISLKAGIRVSKWALAAAFGQHVFDALRATSCELSGLPAAKYSESLSLATPQTQYLALYHSADISAPLILEMIHRMTAVVDSQISRHGRIRQVKRHFSERWTMALRILQLCREHDLLLLWKGQEILEQTDQLVLGERDACLLGNGHDSPRNKRVIRPFTKTGVRSLYPFVVLVQSFLAEYRAKNASLPSMESLKELMSVAKSISQLFHFMNTLATPRSPDLLHHCHDSIPATMDDFFMNSLRDALSMVPNSWLIYYNLLVGVFHLNSVEEIARVQSPHSKDNSKVRCSRKDHVYFGRDIVAKAIKITEHEKACVEAPRDDTEDRVLLFSDKIVAQSYQRVINFLLAELLTSLVHAEKTKSLPSELSAPWEIACRVFQSAHTRLHQVLYASTLPKTGVKDRNLRNISAFYLSPEPFSKISNEALITLLAQARKVTLYEHLYSIHTDMERNFAQTAYLLHLVGATRAVVLPRSNVYRMLIEAQLNIMLRSSNIGTLIRLHLTGPSTGRNDAWTAVSIVTQDHTQQTYAGSCLKMEAFSREQKPNDFLMSVFRKNQKVTNFPILWFLRTIFQRKLIPEVAARAVRSHSRFMPVEDVHTLLSVMHHKVFSWRDALFLYSNSIPHASKSEADVLAPKYSVFRDMHKSLFDFFFRNGTDFLTKSMQLMHAKPANEDAVNDHFYIFFIFFRHYALSTLRSFSQSELFVLFRSIEEDREIFRSRLTLAAARHIAAMAFYIQETYFHSAVSKYPTDHALRRAVQYKDMLACDGSWLIDAESSTVDMTCRQPFTSFFLEYISMLHGVCLPFFYLNTV